MVFPASTQRQAQARWPEALCSLGRAQGFVLKGKEIARSLGLADGTVKNYVSDILAKLGTRDRTRAVLRAIILGLV